MPSRANTARLCRMISTQWQRPSDKSNSEQEPIVDEGLLELVRLRTSQLHGNEACAAVHRHELLARGEKANRLLQLPNWKESEAFNARERAALAMTEAVTLEGIDDFFEQILIEVKRFFSEPELALLVIALLAINDWLYSQGWSSGVI